MLFFVLSFLPRCIFLIVCQTHECTYTDIELGRSSNLTWSTSSNMRTPASQHCHVSERQRMTWVLRVPQSNSPISSDQFCPWDSHWRGCYVILLKLIPLFSILKVVALISILCKVTSSGSHKRSFPWGHPPWRVPTTPVERHTACNRDDCHHPARIWVLLRICFFPLPTLVMTLCVSYNWKMSCRMW